MFRTSDTFTKEGLTQTPRPADRVFASFVQSYGETATIQRPVAVAVNASGWIYVQDEGASRIRVFNPDGAFVFDFNAGFVRGIGINASTGHVYVLLADCINRYSANGQLLSSWGSHGSGDSQFDDPFSIAVNGTGYVYVADTGNHRIQVFSPLGAYVTQWGSYGESQDDHFESVYGIATNASGHVYVADGGNNSVKVFTETGQFIARWGQYGTGAGDFNSDHAIAVNGTGYVYVEEDANNRIQVFNQTGQFVRTWGSTGSFPGQFQQALGVATNSSGAVFVTDCDNKRVQVFDQYGTFTGLLGKSAADPGCLNGAQGVAVNSTGAIYVADYENDRVQVFSRAGAYLFNWAISRPKALAINASDCVYVSGNTGGAPVQVFAWDGSPLYNFGGGVLSGGNNDIAFNATGHVFVTGTGCVSVFNPAGNHLYTFGSPGSGEQELSPDVTGITIGPGGLVHVLCYYRVKVFTLAGTYVRCYARDLGASSGGFSTSLGRVRVDSAGVAYVVDAGAALVSSFAPDGSLAGEWGGSGTSDGQFSAPRGIMINSSGHAFISDMAKIQLFSTVRIPRPVRPVIAQVTRDAASGVIQLQWGAVAGAISYRVYRSSGVLMFTDWTLVTSAVGTSITEKLDKPDTYHYTVVAWNGYEESEASSVAIVEVPQDWTLVIVVAGIGAPGGAAVVTGVVIHRRKKKTLR